MDAILYISVNKVRFADHLELLCFNPLHYIYKVAGEVMLAFYR